MAGSVYERCQNGNGLLTLTLLCLSYYKWHNFGSSLGLWSFVLQFFFIVIFSISVISTCVWRGLPDEKYATQHYFIVLLLLWLGRQEAQSGQTYENGQVLSGGDDKVLGLNLPLMFVISLIPWRGIWLVIQTVHSVPPLPQFVLVRKTCRRNVASGLRRMPGVCIDFPSWSRNKVYLYDNYENVVMDQEHGITNRDCTDK